jgi:multiple sugar transport system permease protein
MPSVILVSAWMTLGHNVLLFLAGLSEIDRSYYEAAELDGAGPFRLFRHVTLPLLRPTLLFVTVTSLITALSSFALMLILTEGGPARATTVAGLYLYDMAFTDLRLGRASAAAYVLAAIILVFSLLQLRLLRRGGVEAH